MMMQGRDTRERCFLDEKRFPTDDGGERRLSSRCLAKRQEGGRKGGGTVARHTGESLLFNTRRDVHSWSLCSTLTNHAKNGRVRTCRGEVQQVV